MSEYEAFPDYRAMEYNQEEYESWEEHQTKKSDGDECGYDQVVDQLHEE